MAEPIFVETDIDNRDEAADGPMKSLSGDEVLHSCRDAVRVQVKVQHFFPHWNQKTEMVLLAGVFLRDLQLDGHVRFFEATEQGRNRFARLEVDRAVVDLAER